MATTAIYTVLTETASDRPLEKLLEELLLDALAPEPPRLCADTPSAEEPGFAGGGA